MRVKYLNKEKKKQKITHNNTGLKLKEIDQTITELNEIVYPLINEDVSKLDNLINKLKNKIDVDKKTCKIIRKKINDLTIKKESVIIKLELIKNLSKLLSEYNITKRMKDEVKKIVNTLDNLDNKALIRQNDKIVKVIRKYNTQMLTK